MDVFLEFRSLANCFESQQIRYALVGGVALAVHGFPRFTQDIDLMVHPVDLAQALQMLGTQGFEESAPAWDFEHAPLRLHRYAKVAGEDVLLVDVLEPLNDGHCEMVLRAEFYADGDQVLRLISKTDLIALKRLRNSDQDRLDISQLELP